MNDSIKIEHPVLFGDSDWNYENPRLATQDDVQALLYKAWQFGNARWAIRHFIHNEEHKFEDTEAGNKEKYERLKEVTLSYLPDPQRRTR